MTPFVVDSGITSAWVRAHPLAKTQTISYKFINFFGKYLKAVDPYIKGAEID